jgi:hypothetical protein
MGVFHSGVLRYRLDGIMGNSKQHFRSKAPRIIVMMDTVLEHGVQVGTEPVRLDCRFAADEPIKNFPNMCR